MKSYSEIVNQIEKTLETTKYAVFATSDKKGVVSTAQMVLVNDGLTVYMQTDSDFDKIKNIKENPNVAIHIGAYSFKGKATIVGHASDNKMFVEKLKAKHLETYTDYTNLPRTVLIKIELTHAKVWGVFKSDKLLPNQTTITTIDFTNKKVSQIIYDKLN